MTRISSLRQRAGVGTGVVLCSLAAAAGVASGPSATDVLAGLQRRYAAVETIQASFEQRYTGPGINQVESGTFWMKKPGLMRWEYRLPEEKLFIADGRETYLYVPADRQVMVRSFTEAGLRSTPLQFLLGQGDLMRSFQASLEKEPSDGSEGLVLVRLEPKQPEPDYAFLVLGIDVRAFDLRRIVIRERTGNESEFLLSDLRANIKIDRKRFRFQIPKGVEVIRLDER